MTKIILSIAVIVAIAALVFFGVKFWGGKENVNAPPTNENVNTEETMTVKVFFGNSIFDPEVLDCQKNFAVERIIPKTVAVARAALEQLLAGPTEEEKAEGYF